MKVVFCDIDGVLNNGLGVEELRISPARVRHLNKILELTGAKVMTYGNWKHVGHLGIEKALVGAGLSPKNYLGVLSGKDFRERVISDYLKRMSIGRLDFFILDGTYKLTERCLWVRRGLTTRDVDAVVSALEN